MQYDFKNFNQRISEIKEWLGSEFSNLQAGKISHSMISNIKIPSYGAKQNLSNLASINTEDPKTLLVTPFDNSILQNIESTLRSTASFFNISVTEKSIRVIMPDMTTERRQEIEKVVKEKLEEAKKSVKSEREKVLHDLKENKDTFSEDDTYAIKEELQEKVNEINNDLQEKSKNKIEDLNI